VLGPEPPYFGVHWPEIAASGSVLDLALNLLPLGIVTDTEVEMTRSRRKNQSLATLQDAELMAVVLEGRHGSFAAEVAEFFALLHTQLGDESRSKAWGGVASTVRRRTEDRMHANH
jgi:hypothetical protein